YTADRVTIGGWIAFKSEGGNYYAYLNNAAIKTFTNKVAAKNDISVIDIKVSAVDGGILQEGRQGIYVNQDEALNKIVNGLKSPNQTITIALSQYMKDPQTLTVFPDEGIVPGRFPGKYIDIDLTKQLLTIFEGMNQMGQYIISSGKASMPTPTGTRTVINKDPRAWSNKYGLWMPWWMGIGGDYGIHELPEWPGGYKEGESHLGTPVSHGCVRLGVGAAQTVYNWAEIGMPVYIHK
ncbi:MAG: L,D-transpeptidase, partial [Patescibacteria group bacterium]|nr:L,D-transpeptidase [Patescibacteria group bacterium]